MTNSREQIIEEIEDITEQDKDINQLLDDARDSISEYCYTECDAYCCRKGFLILNNEEANLLTDNRISEFEKVGKISKNNEDKFVLDLGKSTGSCPRLENNKCSIHKNPMRPKACKEFPVFLWENNIIKISSRCPAIKENKLYKYETIFRIKGYKILK
jgi:Fe-S-cluster containining protein